MHLLLCINPMHRLDYVAMESTALQDYSDRSMRLVPRRVIITQGG
jgi:hypothetical protein